MGVRYRLCLKILASVITVSSGWYYNSVEQNPVKGVTPSAVSEKDFEVGFSVELCRVTRDMAVALGEHIGAQLELGDTVLGVFDKATRDDRRRGRDSKSAYRRIVSGNS